MSSAKNDRGTSYRSAALEAAKDFYYPEEVLRAIRKAKTNDEIANIMTRARKGKFKD